jgi:Cys-rich protein (TIGR01571 family)
VTSQPGGSVHIPEAGEGAREWQTGVCGCCEGQCCYMCFCFCCATCDVMRSLNEWACLIYTFGSPAIALARTKTRMALGIRGSLCGDHFCAEVCPCLTLCQVYRELDRVGAMSRKGCCDCPCSTDKECMC